MKSVILATMLASAMVFANTVITHNYAGALHDIALDNACITADSVKSVKAVRTCATELKSRTIRYGEGNESYTEWYCPKFVKANLEYPRAFNRVVCTDLRKIGHGEGESLECLAYETEADFLPDVITIRVWEDRGEYSSYPGTTKSFRFPACK